MLQFMQVKGKVSVKTKPLNARKNPTDFLKQIQSYQCSMYFLCIVLRTSQNVQQTLFQLTFSTQLYRFLL